MWDKSAGIPGKDCDTFQGDGEKGSEDYRMLAGRKCRRIMKAHDSAITGGTKMYSCPEALRVPWHAPLVFSWDSKLISVCEV